MRSKMLLAVALLQCCSVALLRIVVLQQQLCCYTIDGKTVPGYVGTVVDENNFSI